MECTAPTFGASGSFVCGLINAAIVLALIGLAARIAVLRFLNRIFGGRYSSAVAAAECRAKRLRFRAQNCREGNDDPNIVL